MNIEIIIFIFCIIVALCFIIYDIINIIRKARKKIDKKK